MPPPPQGLDGRCFLHAETLRLGLPPIDGAQTTPATTPALTCYTLWAQTMPALTLGTYNACHNARPYLHAQVRQDACRHEPHRRVLGVAVAG